MSKIYILTITAKKQTLPSPFIMYRNLSSFILVNQQPNSWILDSITTYNYMGVVTSLFKLHPSYIREKKGTNSYVRLLTPLKILRMAKSNEACFHSRWQKQKQTKRSWTKEEPHVRKVKEPWSENFEETWLLRW
jgi:hypothetical protein